MMMYRSNQTVVQLDNIQAWKLSRLISKVSAKVTGTFVWSQQLHMEQIRQVLFWLD